MIKFQALVSFQMSNLKRDRWWPFWNFDFHSNDHLFENGLYLYLLAKYSYMGCLTNRAYLRVAMSSGLWKSEVRVAFVIAPWIAVLCLLVFWVILCVIHNTGHIWGNGCLSDREWTQISIFHAARHDINPKAALTTKDPTSTEMGFSGKLGQTLVSLQASTFSSQNIWPWIHWEN